MNPLQQLYSEGQSFWLDYIRRDLITSGELKRMIRDEGLRGMTSNPTIFEKAISGSDEYDASIKKAVKTTKSSEELFEILAIQDIQRACDVMRSVYVSSHAHDGYVSIEVSPGLAFDTKGSVEEAIHLWKTVNRPNLMVKIPGTPEGMQAIQDATAAGVNVNITLLFSLQSYKDVVNAYFKGLEKRVKKGLPINKIVSVASFFVSRVDTSVDKMLDQKQPNHPLLHKAAIANAKMAYAYFNESLETDRWHKLKAKGANVQRLLWGSTGTKDKRLSDVYYIEELIGPETVNTIPPATAEAFKDHGHVKRTLDTSLDQAKKDLDALAQEGIDLDKITLELQNEGVKAFIKSYSDLLEVVAAKKELLTGQHDKRLQIRAGQFESAYEEGLKRVDDEKWSSRIWAKEAALWKKSEEHQKIISNSLGWLTVPKAVREKLSLLKTISQDVKKAGFTHALLLGMGGSSLAPEVLRLTFGKKTGFPDLAILDSTEPASVWDRAQRSKPSKTLYIVASKSGSTTEPNAFLAYFYDQVKKEKGAKAGENFIAITDPGTQMEKIAKEKKFRHIVLNPADIGGRYSALSFFGMVPAAIMGLDVNQLIGRAEQMAAVCSARVAASDNPGVRLGTALGILANQGRDKVTFVLSNEISSFATWVEQLIAESTGKEGKGILPVESEEIQDPSLYRPDRVFVSIRLAKDSDTKALTRLRALEKAGHPVIWITLNDKLDIAGEFFRWEFATAVAGAFMGIDPFDQPNVQESKDLTKYYIEEFRKNGKLPTEPPRFESSGIEVYATNGLSQSTSLEVALQILLSEIKPGDYVALLAYLKRDDENWQKLQAIRHAILRATKAATTVGFGPRFLHSTGQLHKGGGNNGIFIQITADDSKDLAIPGEPYSYSILKEAQALGDYSALKNHGRRMLRIHLHDREKGLTTLESVFTKLNHN